MGRDLRAYGFIAMGIVCGLVWGGACGGRSSSSAGFMQAGPQVVTHVSTTTGPIAVPTSPGLNQIIRSITFTPTSPDDVIQYIQVEGMASANNVDVTFWIEVYDASGNEIQRIRTVSSFPTSPAPFAWLLDLGRSWDEGIGPGRHPAGQGYSFPDTSYTITFSVDTVGTWVGQVDTIRFKIVTVEGVSTSDPSPNIT